MLKTSVLAVCLLVLASSSASAQVRGRAFLNDPVTSAEEYARRIESCRTESEIKKGERSAYINLSCEELVRSFNEIPHVEDVSDYRELADYVRTLSFQPCPMNRRVEIARVLASGKVDFFTRELREGEKCLVHLGENHYISSAVCGQWIKTAMPYVFTRTVEKERVAPEAPRAEAPSVAESARRNLDNEIAKLDRQMPRAPEPPAKPRWWSLRRNSGRLAWGAAAIGAALCASGTGGLCRSRDVEIIQEVNVR